MTAPQDIAISEDSNAVSVGSTRLLGGFHGHERTTAQTHDWITPRHIIDALGPFDLDPCMSLHQPWETAASGFTVLDDGLSREWSGHVWLNPPYGSQIAEWMERLARHGDGIALVFARTDTAWAQSILKRVDAANFMKGRVAFIPVGEKKPTANSSGTPSMLLAFGRENAEAIKRLPGVILLPNDQGDGRRDGSPNSPPTSSPFHPPSC